MVNARRVKKKKRERKRERKREKKKGTLLLGGRVRGVFRKGVWERNARDQRGDTRDFRVMGRGWKKICNYTADHRTFFRGAFVVKRGGTRTFARQ